MGSAATIVLNYKLRAFNSASNIKTFSRFDITLSNECTGATVSVDTALIQPVNFAYTVIKDGTK